MEYKELKNNFEQQKVAILNKKFVRYKNKGHLLSSSGLMFNTNLPTRLKSFYIFPRLQELGLLEFDKFIEEIEQITNKRSCLSKTDRNTLLGLFMRISHKR